MSHFVAYILQFQEIIVYKIPPGWGGGSIASLRSILPYYFYKVFCIISCIYIVPEQGETMEAERSYLFDRWLRVSTNIFAL